MAYQDGTKYRYGNIPPYALAATFFAIVSSSALLGSESSGSLSIKVAAIEGDAVPFALGNSRLVWNIGDSRRPAHQLIFDVQKRLLAHVLIGPCPMRCLSLETGTWHPAGNIF